MGIAKKAAAGTGLFAVKSSLRAAFGVACAYHVAKTFLGFEPTYDTGFLSTVTNVLDTQSTLFTNWQLLTLTAFAGGYYTTEFALDTWNNLNPLRKNGLRPIRWAGEVLNSSLNVSIGLGSVIGSSFLGAGLSTYLPGLRASFFDIDKMQRLTGIGYGWDAVSLKSIVQGLAEGLPACWATITHGLSSTIKSLQFYDPTSAINTHPHILNNADALAGAITLGTTIALSTLAWKNTKSIRRSPIMLANYLAGKGFRYDTQDNIPLTGPATTPHPASP